ncbi:hypothetical protein F2981_15750 [Sinorhizobium meliloti]|nr:hypothetical protein [Sinorhizobium meliloti]
MSASACRLIDFRELLRNLPGPDTAALVAARERDGQLTKPPGALGRLEEIAFWLAAWTGRPPAVNRARRDLRRQSRRDPQGVTPFPAFGDGADGRELRAGGAAINQICVAHDLGLKSSIWRSTIRPEDITEEPALSERDCAATMAFGMEAIAGGTDLLCIGEWASATRRSRPPSISASMAARQRNWVGPGTEFGRRRARAQESLPVEKGRCAAPAITCPIRSKSCAARRPRDRGDGGCNSRGAIAEGGPSSSTATSRPRPRRSSRPPTRRRSTIA